MKRDKKIPIVAVNSPAGKKFLKALNEARNKRDDEVTTRVSAILNAVKEKGDAALFEYSRTFDTFELNSRNIRLTAKEIDLQASKASSTLKKTIREAAKRIFFYHKRQMRSGFSLKTAEGTLSQKIVPLTRAAVYIPGGHTMYPSSVLMTVIPALVAGVKEIVAITPPRKELDPGIAFALKLLNVEEIYRVAAHRESLLWPMEQKLLIL